MMWDQIDCPQFIDFNKTIDNGSGDSFFDASNQSATSPQAITGSGRKSRKPSKTCIEAPVSPDIDDNDNDLPVNSPEVKSVYATPKNSTIDSIDSNFSPRHKSSPITNIHLLHSAKKSGSFQKPLPLKPKFLSIIQRLSKNTKAREAEAPKPSKDFWATLRHNTPGKPAKVFEGVTKPVPFKLTQNKRKLDNIENYQPLAEQVFNFERGFKKARLDDGSAAFKIPSVPTVPKTPRLLTKTRVRQRMAKEDEQPAPRYQFKARPVDPRVYSKFGGLPGVNQIRPKPITKPRTPHLATKARCLQRRHTTVGAMETVPFHFRAQPVAPGVLSNESTVVQSRYLTFNKRKASQLQEEHQPHFKAAPMPDFTKVNLPPKPPVEMTLTQPEPFTFDEADRQRWAKRNTRLAELVEEQTKVPHFTARPIPDYSRTGLPKKHEIQLTSPHPFNLHTFSRVKSKQQEEEVQEKPSRSIFPPLPLGDLHTEVRARERARLQLEKDCQDWEQKRLEQEQEKEREREAVKELVEYRRTLVHQAKPAPTKH